MVGYISDSVRLAWGLIYWNIRKSAYRISGRRRPPPCQNPSDSGKAMQTRCEGCVSWDQPRRFRKVCPLLVENPDGQLRCSVDDREVRPYWGRFLRYYGGVFASLYLVCGIGLYAYLRSIGYPISPVHLLWPPKWHLVPQAESGYFFNESRTAMLSGDYRKGLLALANAYEADPKNYIAALEMAENNEAMQPAMADQIYAALLTTHPEHRQEITDHWYHSELARGDDLAIEPLAAGEVDADPSRENFWMRALILASRRSGDTRALAAFRADPAHARWAGVVDMELAGRHLSGDQAIQCYAQPLAPGTPSYGLFFRLDQLMRAGDPMSALDELERHRRELDSSAKVALRLDGLALAQAQEQRERELRALLGQPYSETLMEVVGAHLIRHPDGAALALAYRTLLNRAPAPAPLTVGVWTTYFCAAGASGDFDTMHEIGGRLVASGVMAAPTVQAMDSYFRGKAGSRRVTSFLPFVPLPLEAVYALLGLRPPPAPTA